MNVFHRAVDLPVPAEEAYAWHARPGAFERLVPPWEPVEVRSRSGRIEPGARLALGMSLYGVPVTLEVEHEALNEAGNLGFVDVQRDGPFRSWRHHHRLVPTGPASCRLEDEIHWEAPLGAPAGGFGNTRLERTFAYRHRRTLSDLRHQAAWPAQPLQIAVSGATGLVGGALVHFLGTAGHVVRRLVRREPAPGDIRWDPATGEVDAEALASCDAVIHLAGEPIAGRWTAARKERILRSRVDGTALLARTLARMTRPPRVFVSASAIGWYGSRGDEVLTEASSPGQGFLAEVAAAWEAAAQPAVDAGIRVVHPRIGIVLSGWGGALQAQSGPASFGLGGPIGGGGQWVSWIALDDLLGLLLASLSERLDAGPYNATAPEPATQGDFARTLGRVLGRPAFAPVPGALVRLLGGEAGQAILLDGQRVLPARAQAAGFTFAYPTLEQVLRHELGV